MANNNSGCGCLSGGCFVVFMKFVILLLFIGGFIFMIGREFFVHDYIKVVQKAEMGEASGTNWKDGLNQLFTDGKWEQQKSEYSDYPRVIYTGKINDQNGKAHEARYVFDCSNDITGFQVQLSALYLDGNLVSGIDGADCFIDWYGQIVGQP